MSRPVSSRSFFTDSHEPRVINDEKRRAAAQLGSAAELYFDSEVHRLSADHETLASRCRGATRALDAVTEADHTAGVIADAGVSSVVAVGAAPEMVTAMAHEYPVTGVVADAERLPFADDVFDTAACRIAAHHLPDPEAFVIEVAHVLELGNVSAFEGDVAPEDATLAAFLNGVGVLRDSTYVELYPVLR